MRIKTFGLVGKDFHIEKRYNEQRYGKDIHIEQTHSYWIWKDTGFLFFLFCKGKLHFSMKKQYREDEAKRFNNHLLVEFAHLFNHIQRNFLFVFGKIYIRNWEHLCSDFFKICFWNLQLDSKVFVLTIRQVITFKFERNKFYSPGFKI